MATKKTLKGSFKGLLRKLAVKTRRLFKKKPPKVARLPGPKKGRKKALLSLPDSKALETTAVHLPQAPSLPAVGVSEAMEEFVGVQLSPHSRRAYAQDLKDFFSYCRRRDIWKDWNLRLNPLLLAEYRNYLLEERKLAKSSITRKLATLKSFCRWAKARGWLHDNPAEGLRSFPQSQDSRTGFLSDAEIDRLLGSFPGPLAEVGLFRALCRVSVETLLMLGLRRSEAAAIRMGHLERSEERWLLRVQGKGDRERLLPLPPRLERTWSEWIRRLHPHAPARRLGEDPSAWQRWLKDHRDLSLLVSSRAKDFEGSLSTAEIGRIVRRSGRRAGLVQKVSPHMLRASAITHALDQGASHRGVQQMAGWTSPLMITRYDKRRKDPRHSAVHTLLYARDEEAEVE